MKIYLDSLAFLMILLSSHGVFPILMSGGAHDQFDRVEQTGLLNYMPLIWKSGVTILIFLIFIKHKFRYFKGNLINFVLILFFLATPLWAIIPKASYYTSINTLFSFIIINLQINIFGLTHTIKFLNKSLLIILTLSLLFVFLLPSYGLSVGDHAGSWQGVFDHKNGLGCFSSFTLIFYYWLINNSMSKIKINYYGFFSSAVLVIGSNSSTSWGISIFCILFYAIMKNFFIEKIVFYNRHIIIFFFMALSAYIVISSVNGDMYSIDNKDSTYSGRDKIWSYVIDEIESNPILGHGLDYFNASVQEDETYILQKVGIPVLSSHNGFLESAFSIGFLGSIILFIALMQLLTFKKINPIFDICFLYLLYLIILNTFEARLFGFTFQFIIFLYFSELRRLAPKP